MNLRILMIVLAVASSFGKPVAAQEVSAETVESSIESAIEFLRINQLENGRWKGYENYGSGQTALVTLALLNCGVPPEEAMIRRALRHLETVSPKKTYETALLTMVFCAANPKRYAANIETNVKWLEESQLKDSKRHGPDEGGWGYDFQGGGADESNSQFGVLALWEAQRVKISVDKEALRLANKYWKLHQLVEPQANPQVPQMYGAWRYNNGGPTGSMTCAGIASILMTEEALELSDASVKGNKLHCCGEKNQRERTDLAIEWLSRNFQIAFNPGGGGFWIYYLYALERVGRLTGQRYFGNQDWYREGCKQLLKKQSPTSGYISDDAGETERITNTAMALLFLSKGKRQIVMGRLELEQDSIKQHPRAIQNVTGHIELAWKKDLAWQTVKFKNAKLEDLLQAPVLFWSGSEAIKIDDAGKKLLKEYIDNGGFLFAEARNGDGCKGEAFEISFRELMQELFDKPLNRLDPSHPIWYAEGSVDVSALPPDFWLYGLENCCRTSVVLSPISLSCRWDLYRPYGMPSKLPGPIEEDCRNATLLGINVATYATGRELKQKLDAVEVIRMAKDPITPKRGTLRLPRLEHSGGADDTPRAIANLMGLYKREVPSQVVTESPLITITNAELEEPSVVYLSGRRSFQFTGAEREALRTFLTQGGTIIGDSICGSDEFTESVHKELQIVLPNAKWSRVSDEHPMLTSEYQGYDIRRVSILNPGNEKGQAIQMQKYEGTPVLEVLLSEGQPVVIFSPYDLSCALESRQSTQCRGYSRTDAAKIAVNILLYSLLK